jgi:hypothetical protein
VVIDDQQDLALVRIKPDAGKPLAFVHARPDRQPEGRGRVHGASGTR